MSHVATTSLGGACASYKVALKEVRIYNDFFKGLFIRGTFDPWGDICLISRGALAFLRCKDASLGGIFSSVWKFVYIQDTICERHMCLLRGHSRITSSFTHNYSAIIIKIFTLFRGTFWRKNLSGEALSQVPTPWPEFRRPGHTWASNHGNLGWWLGLSDSSLSQLTGCQETRKLQLILYLYLYL